MVDEEAGGGRAGRVIAGSLALLSRLFFIAMVSRGFSPRGWLLRKGGGGGGEGEGEAGEGVAAEGGVQRVGMRSRYNHGENYFQAPGRIISTPLRRLSAADERGGGGWEGKNNG
jgi:hypothetical protein